MEFPVTPAFAQRLQDNYSNSAIKGLKKRMQENKKYIFRQTCEGFCSVMVCNCYRPLACPAEQSLQLWCVYKHPAFD